MGRPRKSFLTDDLGEVTPQAHHAATLVQRDHERKSNKPAIIEETVEMVISSFNRRKYVKVCRMENGNTYRFPISKAEFEAKK